MNRLLLESNPVYAAGVEAGIAARLRGDPERAPTIDAYSSGFIDGYKLADRAGTISKAMTFQIRRLIHAFGRLDESGQRLTEAVKSMELRELHAPDDEDDRQD